MTDQEKAALLQFMGVTHAQAKQADQMIVGPSQFLKPISNDISRQFEQVLRTPVESQQPVPQVYDQHHYNPQPVYTPVEMIPAHPQQQQQPDELQLEFQFSNTPKNETNEIINQLKEINLNLVKIAAILTENNVKAKTKNTIKS